MVCILPFGARVFARALIKVPYQACILKIVIIFISYSLHGNIVTVGMLVLGMLVLGIFHSLKYYEVRLANDVKKCLASRHYQNFW